jgi:hypothetical protein
LRPAVAVEASSPTLSVRDAVPVKLIGKALNQPARVSQGIRA